MRLDFIFPFSNLIKEYYIPQLQGYWVVQDLEVLDILDKEAVDMMEIRDYMVIVIVCILLFICLGNIYQGKLFYKIYNHKEKILKHVFYLEDILHSKSCQAMNRRDNIANILLEISFFNSIMACFQIFLCLMLLSWVVLISSRIKTSKNSITTIFHSTMIIDLKRLMNGATILLVIIGGVKIVLSIVTAFLVFNQYNKIQSIPHLNFWNLHQIFAIVIREVSDSSVDLEDLDNMDSNFLKETRQLKVFCCLILFFHIIFFLLFLFLLNYIFNCHDILGSWESIIRIGAAEEEIKNYVSNKLLEEINLPFKDEKYHEKFQEILEKYHLKSSNTW